MDSTEPSAASEPFVAVHVLCYGDYPHLARRCLNTCLADMPPDTPVVIGLNSVSDKTAAVVQEFSKISLQDVLRIDGGVATNGRFTLITMGNGNPGKYPMMRRMFDASTPSKWVLWLDDDTHMTQRGWWEKIVGMLGQPGACYVGEEWWSSVSVEREAFIRKRPYFKGLPLLRRNGTFAISFHTGGFFLLRRDVRDQLNWPDPDLRHNGGDSLLSEAVRQAGLPRHRIPARGAWGIKVNGHVRRGLNEIPLGATRK